MNRRYVFRGPTRAALAALVPTATITEAGGVVEVIVPEADVLGFDRNLPAPPEEVEAVADLQTRLTAVVRADLLEALRAARGGNLAPLRAAVDALSSDATTRNRRS